MLEVRLTTWTEFSLVSLGAGTVCTDQPPGTVQRQSLLSELGRERESIYYKNTRLYTKKARPRIL